VIKSIISWFRPRLAVQFDTARDGGITARMLRESADEIERLEAIVKKAPARLLAYPPHIPGDGLRFHIRQYNGGVWQVYGQGLDHICDCNTSSIADMIADSLEAVSAIQLARG